MKTHGLRIALFGLAGGILASILFSCGSNNGNKELAQEILNIDVNNTKPLSDIFKDFHNFPVSESDTFPGIINAGTIVNDTLYILDPRKAPGVYVYTSDGKLINKFPTIGSGPGEMGMITDMVVDNDYVHLYDFMKFSVETYSHEGKWIKSTAVPGGVSAFMKDENGIWCDFANQSYSSDDQSNKLIYKRDDNDWRDRSMLGQHRN